jgi:hypothetical protein
MDRDSSSLHADTFLDDVNHKLQNEEEGVQQSSHSSSGPTTEGLLIDEIRSRGEDRTAKGIISPLDVAEVLRRWTHALQRIHKQAVRLVWFYLFILNQCCQQIVNLIFADRRIAGFSLT